MISQNAINYTFQQLLKVALPDFDSSFFTIEVSESEYCIHFGQSSITMPKMNEAQWQAFLKGEMKPCWVDNAAGTIQIPLFGPEDNSFDIITPSFAFLSRYEEFFAQDADAHGRFPYQGSLAQKYDLVEIPIVDEYAMILRRNLCACSPETLTPSPRKPKVVPTHDIDILYRFTGRFQAWKSILGRDLLINRSLSMVRESIKSYRNWKIRPSLDPYVEAINEFLVQEEKQKLSSIFFFKATEDGHPDATYELEDPILHEVIGIIMQPGYHQIGLHGSYPSANDLQCLQKEKQNLSKLCDEEIRISRQHYLRTFFADDSNSLDLWRQAGITDDYTLGFAERCGFRCGTCHPYPLYDVRNDRVTNIIEHPLIVMDGTLFDYMKLPVEDAKMLVMKLKQRCFDVEGDFIILWHNHATTREFKPYYKQVYLPLIDN